MMTTNVAKKRGIRDAMAKNRAPRWLMPLVRTVIITSDLVVSAASFIIAFKLREGEPILSGTAWAWSPDFVPYVGVLIFTILLRPAMLLYQRVYRFHGEFSYSQDAIRIFKAVSVSS